MKREMLYAAAGLALLAPFPAHAQEEGTESEPKNEIVVTGEGLEPPLSTIVFSTVEIEREAIVSSGSGRIEDVLANVAGFQQFRRSDSRSR